MKGQGSIEYMAIVATMLVVFAAFTHSQMVGPGATIARETEDLSMARDTCDKIAASINRVYKNTENSRTFEFVEFSRIENLEITEDNVQISIFYDGELTWVKSNIEYGFENHLSNIPNGSYTAIVEWNTSKPEGLWLIRENDKIYINIKPGGG